MKRIMSKTTVQIASRVLDRLKEAKEDIIKDKPDLVLSHSMVIDRLIDYYFEQEYPNGYANGKVKKKCVHQEVR